MAFYTGDSQQSKVNAQNQPSKQSHHVTACLLGCERICTQILFLHLQGVGKQEPGVRKQAGKLLHIPKPTDLVETSQETRLFFVTKLTTWESFFEFQFLKANRESQPLLLHTPIYPRSVFASSFH